MNITPRHKTRRYVLQALYQWHISGDSVSTIAKQFIAQLKNDRVDTNYFKQLFYGITKDASSLDQRMVPFLDRQLQQLTPIEQQILRLASYELLCCHDVPYRCAINEALELAKTFGSTKDGYKYVNGILDHIACQLRGDEIKIAK